MNKYVIETKQLTKTYGEQTVVNSVNIHVEQGQIVSVIYLRNVLKSPYLPHFPYYHF